MLGAQNFVKDVGSQFFSRISFYTKLILLAGICLTDMMY